MKRLGLKLAAVVMMLAGGVGLAMPVMADGTICDDGDISDELKEAAGCNTTKVADSMINSLIRFVLTLVGLIAVGAMIYGGYLYLMSAGDAAKVKRGQDVLKYGLIGLVVTLLAYAIVYFVAAAAG